MKGPGSDCAVTETKWMTRSRFLLFFGNLLAYEILTPWFRFSYNVKSDTGFARRFYTASSDVVS
jgi:hypothetical membrane protein